MGIPSAVLWVQSCSVFSAYYHFYNNLASFPTVDEPHLQVTLPGLPTLESHEIPSFLHPSNPHKTLERLILGQYKNLSKAFRVLVDSFHELEQQAVKPLLNLAPIRTIGPLFYPYKEVNLCGDFVKAEDCMEWLDNQPLSSVIYVSFGSVVNLKNDHMEEIALGLLNSEVKFVWVVREQPKEIISKDVGKLPDGFMKQAAGKGLVVPWCAQDRMLAHPSVACFITHCGWNSATESLCCGVPVVAFPQWGDQVTNAKFLVDVFGVGVRLITSKSATLSREDVERCIVDVMRGPKAEKMKNNAVKWKKAAEGAVEAGGSSDRNVHEFVNQIQGMKVKEFFM